MKGKSVSVGIELDIHSIRAVKIRNTISDKPVLSAFEEIPGSFIKDEDILNGLKTIKQRLQVSVSDLIVTALGGKQTYAAQIAFKKMADDEMRTALKFELRKNLPFDSAGSTVAYQFLSPNVKKNETSQVMVTAVSNIILQRYLRLFEKAGMRPGIIDVFPLTVANAFHLQREHEKDGTKNATLIHIGSEYSTIVIDGEGIPFFNRTIYFAASEILNQSGTETDSIAPRETERRIQGFTEEIVRSLAYYETTHHMKPSDTITLLGNYLMPELLQKIEHDTGLSVRILNLIGTLDKKRSVDEGKFDIALTLSMRN